MTPVTLPSRSKGKDTTLDARRDGAAAGTVKVTRDGEMVRFVWTCGDSRVFELDDVLFTLENLERIVPYGEVIFADTDSRGSKFYARIEDGRFYADTRPQSTDGASIPWLTFRRAILMAVGTKESKADAKKGPEPIDEDDWRRANE